MKRIKHILCIIVIPYAVLLAGVWLVANGEEYNHYLETGLGSVLIGIIFTLEVIKANA